MNCLTMSGVVSAAIVPFKTLLTVDCDGPKSSLVHCCIFPVAKKRRVIITFSSAVKALFRIV